jgi:hypothetical protein
LLQAIIVEKGGIDVTSYLFFVKIKSDIHQTDLKTLKNRIRVKNGLTVFAKMPEIAAA